jgi:hypothetical protein
MVMLYVLECDVYRWRRRRRNIVRRSATGVEALF